MKTKNRQGKKTIDKNGDVARLDHMIGHSLARKTTYKPGKKISNERALFEMIDTRIGHMLAKSCEIESKLDAIEKKRPPRKPKVNKYTEEDDDSNEYSADQINQEDNINSDSEDLSDSVPRLKSASKFLNQESIVSDSKQKKIPQAQPSKPTKTISQNINIQQNEESSFISNEPSMEALLALIQTLANEVTEMHEEQNILKEQIQKMQECIFTND